MRSFKARELGFSRGKLCKKQYAAYGLLTHPNHFDKSAGIRCVLLTGEKPPVAPDRLKEKIPAQDLRGAEDEMPVGNLLEHLGTEPFPEFHHPLLMTGSAEILSPSIELRLARILSARNSGA
jgi:hypothetical protein